MHTLHDGHALQKHPAQHQHAASTCTLGAAAWRLQRCVLVALLCLACTPLTVTGQPTDASSSSGTTAPWTFNGARTKADVAAATRIDPLLSALNTTRAQGAFPPDLELEMERQFSAWAAAWGYTFDPTSPQDRPYYLNWLLNIRLLQAVNAIATIPYWLGERQVLQHWIVCAKLQA